MHYYFKLLIALLLCICIPLIVIAVVTNYNASSFYEQMMAESQINRLNIVSNTFELVFSTIERDATRISLGSAIRSLNKYNTLDELLENSEDTVGVHRTLKVLWDYVHTNDLVESVYLYIDSSNYIISSNDGVMLINDFADMDWMPYYENLYQDRNASRILPSRVVRSSFQGTSYVDGILVRNFGRTSITYIYPVSQYISSFKGALVFNLLEDRLIDAYLSHGDDSATAILTEQGTLISATKEFNPLFLPNNDEVWSALEDNTVIKGYFPVSIDDMHMLTYFYKSDYDNLVYFGMEDMSVVMAQNTAFRISLLVAVLALLCLGGLSAYLLSRRLYSPVKMLVRELSSNNRLDLTRDKDEMTAISRAVQDLLQDEKTPFGDNGHELIREASFMRVLSGQGDSSDLAMLGISNNARTVCVLASPDEPKSTQNEIFDPSIRLLVHMCVEVLSENGDIHATGIRYKEDLVAIMVSTNEPDKDLYDIIEEKLREIQHEFFEAFNSTITFTMGSVQEDSNCEGLCKSFEQASQILTYRFIKGYNSIILYDNIYPETNYYSAKEKIRQIKYYLKDGNKEELFVLVEELFEEISTQNHISYNNVMQILNRLAIDLAQYVEDSHIKLTEMIEDGDHIYRQMWQKKTLQEMASWLKEIYGAVIDYQNIGSTCDCEHVNQAVEYVKNNFTNDITINSVAEHIGISYSYLRKIFKDSTGRNLTDYIHDMRIEMAKNLLRSTRLTIKEISAKCGYSHDRTFSRAFLQAEKVTPGRYRELNKS